MKILFLISEFQSGGAERTVAYLSDYFVNNGQEVTILAQGSQKFYDLNNKVKFIRLFIPAGFTNIFNHIYRRIKAEILTKKQIKNEKPDVVILFYPSMVKYIKSCKRKNYKIISSERAEPSQTSNKLKKIRLKAFRKCDGIIFQTTRAKNFFPQDIKNKSIVIENAVGNPLVYNDYSNTIKKEIISAVGRLAKQKDYITLLKAFKLVHEKHPEFKLNIYGEGPEKNNLEIERKKLLLDDCVCFCGNNQDALKLISSSKCYVLSSKFEGMPNALMEAMAIGLPCVSTDCPNGPRELITNNVNGLLVPVGDEKEMANAILKIIENEEFASYLGNQAKKILETHSLDKNAKKYLDYIKKINC